MHHIRDNNILFEWLKTILEEVKPISMMPHVWSSLLAIHVTYTSLL